MQTRIRRNWARLQVSVHMRDGVMTASFETSNDDATRMLSHSLGSVEIAALEASGVSVEKIHVQQSPNKQESKGGDSEQRQRRGSTAAARGRSSSAARCFKGCGGDCRVGVIRWIWWREKAKANARLLFHAGDQGKK